MKVRCAYGNENRYNIKPRNENKQKAMMMSFLLEVGTEELPANFLGSAIVQWRSLIPQSLANHGLNPEKVEVYGTPRRLAVVITGLPEKQADRTEEIKLLGMLIYRLI